MSLPPLAPHVRSGPIPSGHPASSQSAPGDRAPAAAPALSRDELVRYARHLALPQLGLSGQQALSSARVLVVGTGGLGSPVALYLAAAGVGTIGLIDDDRVDATNLQRQIVHGTASIGRSKVESAAERLHDLNPHTRIVTFDERLTRHNGLDVLAGWDLLVDGSDNFPTRYLVNDAAVLSGTPLIYGAILRWEGQASLFATPDGPCYRCLFREPPPPDLVPSCADAGVVGALPGVVGSVQALEAVKWITGVGTSLRGRLVLFDGLAMSWREIEVRRDPECPACGDTPSITELIDYEWFCGMRPDGDADPASGTGAATAAAAGRSPSPRSISARALDAALATAEPPLLIDVREPWEWSAGNLAERGSVHIPLTQLRDRIDELPHTRPLVTLCSVGARSAVAANLLRERGLTQARNLDGGLQAWVRDVDPSFSLV